MPNDIRCVADAVERMLRAGGVGSASGLQDVGGADPSLRPATGAPRSGQVVESMLAEACDDLRLALTEALNNVVEHGGGAAFAPLIRLRLWRDGRRLVFCIEDDGPPVPDAVPALSAETAAGAFAEGCDLAHLPEGGWGLMLIEASVDRVRRHRSGGRNRLFLEKALPA